MKTLVFREHALLRMAERGISHQDVKAALERGEVIRHYPDDTPYPSRLLLHWIEGQPLHVVAAPVGDDTEIVITVYRPDPALWEPDFKRKRP
ncbi:MAG: DUF4258 domain-containing protein [Candidatus Contendobacter sp.]|nr:DUF4258 domain-containing protein [Candidatus Contendobacter sp.]